MNTVIVGSYNPVKLATTQEAFGIAFPRESFEFVPTTVASGVPDQPFGEEETRTGARNRSDGCTKTQPDAAYFVGHEGGLLKVGDDMWAFAWMCVQDNAGMCGFGRTGSFLLPPAVSERIRGGEELGTASDIVFQKTNSKQKGGSVGILTNGVITRKDFYYDAMIFALIPFMQRELYP